MNSFLQTFFLSVKDYWHERLLSLCSVLGLAAGLTPLLVLLGVHNGIITALTEHLLQDPRTLEVTPVGSGHYGPGWFEELGDLPQVAFVIPQTRTIAATITLRTDQAATPQVHAPLQATARQDPLLDRYAANPPRFFGRTVPHEAGSQANQPIPSYQRDAPVSEIILPDATARKLGIGQDYRILGHIERTRSGRRESQTFPLLVSAVLPPEAQNSNVTFIPLKLLLALEDYRDGKAVPELDWQGDLPGQGLETDPLPGPDTQPCQRTYASFRLYAKSLDDIEPLSRFFESRKIEVYVRSAEIETVKSLDRAFTIVFALISGAAFFGFAASTASSSLAGVKRKSRSLGILRLMGFSRSGILLFPVIQAGLTGLVGFLFALGLYATVAICIDLVFAGAVPGGRAVCVLPLPYAFTVCLSVLGLSALASSLAAIQATRIEPSEVIRDV